MNYAAQLAALAAAQTETIARHRLDNGETVWLRKAAPRQAAWRYSLLNGLAKVCRLGVLTPVPNPGGEAGIAIEAGRLRELAEAGITAPKLLAVQDNALLMSHVGEQTLLIAIEKQTEAGSLEGWLQGLHAIEAVHRQNQFLSQAFARNMVLTETGGIGFIAPYSKDFCNTCNRLRVTSQGKMHLCLFGGVSYDLRDFLRRGDREGLTEFLHETMRLKPEHHYLHNKKVGLITNLSMTGG